MRIDLKPVETLVYQSDVVAFGTFRCPSTHPMFRDSGPCTHNSVVFPRTSTIIRHRGGNPFTASPNCATLYNERQEYTREAVSDIDASDWFVINDESLLPFSKAHLPVTSTTYLRQRRLFDRVRDLQPLEIDEEAVSIVAEVMASQMPQPVSPTMRDKVEAVKRLIALAPERHVSLKQLAAATECSPFHLCREFRKQTAMTITQFQHDLRLRVSLDLLLQDRRTDLADIALQLGFASHSHFSSLFRRRFGITPSRFRARS